MLKKCSTKLICGYCVLTEWEVHPAFSSQVNLTYEQIIFTSNTLLVIRKIIGNN